MIEYGQDLVDTIERNNVQRYLVRQLYKRSLFRGERGAVPSTDRRAHLRRRPLLSRSDPMPALFVVGLAVLVALAFFGLISIGQMLQRIAGG